MAKATKNGQRRPHANKCGYIVVSPFGAATACYGFNDCRDTVLLYGRPVTIFKKKSQAKHAIEKTKRSFTQDRTNYQVLRVAFRL